MKTETVKFLVQFIFMPDDIVVKKLTDDENLEVYDVIEFIKDDKIKSVVIMDCDKLSTPDAILKNNAIFVDCKEFIAFIPIDKYKKDPKGWKNYSYIVNAEKVQQENI